MIMKKNQLLLAALAATTLAGCSSDDLLGDAPSTGTTEPTNAPIVFSSFKSKVTRAGDDITGAEAAELLGNKFVVSGYKGSKTAWQTENEQTENEQTGSAIVFDNYLVEYAENSAHTTESNTSNWEYVGKGRIKHAIDNGVTQQAIKYWDYSKDQYDFIAWSVGKKTAIYDGTPDAGEVLVSAITPATATGTGDDVVAYTFTGKAADLEGAYIADLVTVKKADYARGDDAPVTLRFRSLGTKVRIAIYETVPGYSVKDVQFYSAAATDDAATTPRIFTTTANDIYTEGTYTVYFPTVDDESKADNNQAHVKFTGTGTQSTIVKFDNLNYTIAEDGERSTGAVFLGRTAATASFAGNAANNYYTQYLPNETGTNLNLRVNYTLESIDGSGETIVVKGATAQVPSIYTTWKSGFAYTYIFKITDKTNGHTGVYDPTKPDDISVNSDPAGLYPITFDALVVNDETTDNTQETITLISTPSITTYQQGSNVVNNNEYLAATGDIFVTVNDGETESTPDLANGKLQVLTDANAALYTIPDGKTEAEVIDALSIQDDDAAAGTIKGRSGLVLTEADLTLATKVIYGVDGNVINLGAKKAAKFTPTANTTYAFVYTKKASTTDTEIFQPVTKAKGESVAGLYRWQMGNAPNGDVQAGVKYFHSGKSDQLTVFLGQTVNNLYLDADGTTIASGYAVTGTDYYYTTDHGMHYTKATNIAYEAFASATDLYTLVGTDYTLKTDTEPADGTAYYQRTGAGTGDDPYAYTYCVILPQQTRPAGGQKLVILDTTKDRIKCQDTETASNGIEYFDKYTKNDGVYYTKIIKVQ